MRRILLTYFLSFSIVWIATGQTNHQVSWELGFVKHLLQMKAYDDAIFVLKELQDQPMAKSQQDSVNYLLATTYFQKQQLQQAVSHFGKVSPLTPFTTESRFYQAYAQANLEHTQQSIDILMPLQLKDSVLIHLRDFELASNYLLQRNFQKFDSLATRFDGRYFQFASHEKNLLKAADQLKNIPKRSMFVAGAMSAVVPGLGKVYAGKTSQGISSFLQTGMLGVLTYESYRKAGVNSARFYIFGTIFSVFYIGNIWGSSLAVRVKQNEINHEVDHQVLFDMHVPLRTIFK